MKILKNLEWVYEKITEYANIEMIEENSIIYGGILRDVIAKKELIGDIDMVVLNSNLHKQLYKLNHDFEWTKLYRNQYSLKNITSKYKPLIDNNNLYIKNKPTIDYIHEFKNYNNRLLQIIVTENITKLIQDVDFTCCGLGLDNYGNITEYLDNAYNDCITNKLRLNIHHSNPKLLLSRYKHRLLKLEKRGWIPHNISKDKKILYKQLHKQKNKKTVEKKSKLENLFKMHKILNKIIIKDPIYNKHQINIDTPTINTVELNHDNTTTTNTVELNYDNTTTQINNPINYMAQS